MALAALVRPVDAIDLGELAFRAVLALRRVLFERGQAGPVAEELCEPLECVGLSGIAEIEHVSEDRGRLEIVDAGRR